VVDHGFDIRYLTQSVRAYSIALGAVTKMPEECVPKLVVE
jgi:hypothetical protein